MQKVGLPPSVTVATSFQPQLPYLYYRVLIAYKLIARLDIGSSYCTVKAHFWDRSHLTMVISQLWDSQDVAEAVHKGF